MYTGYKLEEVIMRKLISSIVALIAVLIACAMPVQADGFHGAHGGGHGGGWGWGPAIGLGIGLGVLGAASYYANPYPYYPYYPSAPVMIQPQQEIYVQPAPAPQQQTMEPNYWYFCADANGYYPYVRQCPGGWMKVVPMPPAPQK